MLAEIQIRSGLTVEVEFDVYQDSYGYNVEFRLVGIAGKAKPMGWLERLLTEAEKDEITGRLFDHYLDNR